MLRTIAALTAALLCLAFATAPPSLAAPPKPAAAATVPNPTLRCQVIGNNTGVSGGIGTGSCGTYYADSAYLLDFGVEGLVIGNYYWTAPDTSQIVRKTCWTNPHCDIVVPATRYEQTITVKFQAIDEDLQWHYFSISAYLPEVCGTRLC
ncbi:hypothetical protein [Actinomadura parmotrematis]|uniref:Secreted protein n=1 Tax=Actinomadura parmotrematis TaxID=2864039 RepID=A0ABS7FQD0_9ACTN|nr:hypothetical protein [Actinomadura parmotrematis]MBW8482175.1 hypothetical protein [Actinomadura parmotrematis]